jgi:hypothetical protein
MNIESNNKMFSGTVALGTAALEQLRVNKVHILH